MTIAMLFSNHLRVGCVIAVLLASLGDEQDGRKEQMNQSMLLLVVLWLVTTVKATTDPRDTAALEAFRNAIGDQMGRLSNWKGNDPCGAAWEGVICDFDAIHVIELRLLNHNLTGSLAPELGNLLSLQTLDVMWNNISGVIPGSLGKLQALELLLLNGNSLTGEIPPELGNLSRLRRLQLDENQIGGPIPPTFGNLTSVKHLHLNNNSLSGSIPPDLGRLPHLIHLLLDNNNLSGTLPPELSSISTLITLQLDNNRFDDPIIPLEYVRMPSLVKLSLQNCSLQGSIPALTRLTPLEYIGLGGNQLNATMPSTLPQNLTVFDASSNNLTGNISESVGDLTKLQALILRDNHMGGAVPSVFAQRASDDQLLILDIQNNSFSAINSSLPEWLQLWVSGNPKICTGQFQFSPVCAPRNLSSVDQLLPPTDTTCQKETCTLGVDELVPSLASEGVCRCATPIPVVYRLKSPSFILFTPYAALLQEYLSNRLNLTSDQVFLDTSQWEPGHRRLRIHIKLFPAVLTQTAREFNQTEAQRLYDAFARFQIPDTPLFGPFELVSFASGSLTNEKPEKQTGLSRGMLLAVVIVSVVGISAIAVAGILVLFRRRSLAKRGKFRTGLEGFKVAGAKSFTLEEMNKATDSFSETRLVGVGGYGNVYKGILEDGSPVAVKRAREGSLQGSHEFQTEIELLSRIHHRNLVSLVGYCCDEGEQMLVYEFMPGGTLHQHLSSTSKFDFSTRLQIALGAARGILYLHTEANPPIIHRDIKASNILLDENNVAKVADFGLSKLAPAPLLDGSGAAGHISTVVKGTPGYLDPEYFLTHKLTDKSDVYSYGVVLLELITGMQAIQHGKNLVREVLLCYNAGTVLSIVDPRMGPYASDSLEPLLRLAIAACDPSIVTRPSMSDIVRSLENILQTVPWSIPQSNDKSDSKALLMDAYDDPSTTVYTNVAPR